MNEPLWTFVYVLNFSLCMFLFLFGTHLEVGLLNHVQSIFVCWNDLLLSGRWSRPYFPYSSWKVQIKTLDIMFNTNVRRLWKVERSSQTSEGPQDPRNDTEVSFLVSYSLMYARLEVKAATWKCQLVQTEKPAFCSPSKEAHDQEEAAWQDRVLGDSCFTPTKRHRIKTLTSIPLHHHHHPHQRQMSRECSLLPLPGCKEASQPLGLDGERPTGSWDVHPHQAVRGLPAPRLLQCSGDHMEPGLPPPPRSNKPFPFPPGVVSEQPRGQPGPSPLSSANEAHPSSVVAVEAMWGAARRHFSCPGQGGSGEPARRLNY